MSTVETRLSAVETRLGDTEKLLWGVLLGVIALVVKAYLPIQQRVSQSCPHTGAGAGLPLPITPSSG
jgi:hypothetical protein